MTKHLRPDTRLDWRDPSMPVIRHYKMRDGEVVKEVDPDYEQRYRTHMLSANLPTWDRDPTYNLRRTKGHLR